MSSPDVIEEKIKALPPRPGCYVFRDKHQNVLYVGKAKSLRARVRSYFQQGGTDDRAFIPFLRRKVGDLETFVTSTEKEAAILENSLIKEYTPRYNVKLRDDKEYLNLRLSLEHEWPRLDLVRRPSPDKARYFGPYHSATAARRTLHLVEKHFQLRTCSDRDLVSRKRPCLQYQIKRCPAPCVFDVDKDLYGQQVRAVSLFLDGRHDELTRELTERMERASAAMEYELAALYRDQLVAVRSIREQQRVVAVTDKDQDVLGLYREGDLVELSVMHVRSGRVVDIASHSHPKVEVPDDEVVAAFVRDQYGDGGPLAAHIPDEVLVPVLPEGAEGVSEWLSECREQTSERGRSRCHLLRPERGPKRRLLELAQENAEHSFKEKQRAKANVDDRLARIQHKLRLPVLPRRIECCDISHLGGDDTVGAVVAFQDGAPDKARYKSYRVKGVADGDDYAAMYEVLLRRFRRGAGARRGNDTGAMEEPRSTEDEQGAVPGSPDVTASTRLEAPPPTDEVPGNDALWELPDLFLVDGGKGQLAVALTAAADLGLHDLCVAGLAKERETPLGDKVVDRVYLPGQKNPVNLKPNTPELYILAHARDEAHRVANHLRKRVGKRRRFESALDTVPGIGPKTRRALLSALGSVTAVRAADDETLLAVPGVTRRQVAALREHLKSER